MTILNNEFFIVFILAHMIGDYVLQTDKLAQIKSEGVKGLMVHSVVVCASHMLLGIFGLKGFAAGLIAGFIHFFIDYSKTALVKLFTRMELLCMLLDQVLHVLVMWVLTVTFMPGNAILGKYIFYVRILISFIFLTYLSTVVVKMLLRDLFPGFKKMRFFEKHERLIDAMAAIILWAIWFLPTVAAAILLLPLFFAYHLLQKKLFDFKLNISIIKYIILVSAGLIAIC